MASPDDYLLMSVGKAVGGCLNQKRIWNNNGPKTNAPPKAACSIPAAMMLP